ncbi:MAG: thiamine pyrophosphate-binding protein [Oscillospiraceae bacterium]|nr:thiamine pyrophosphate-binding protein [Oscillospiraceae bacterium]
MKATDYIVEFLVKKGVQAVFGYPGGMVTHLMDSLYKASGISTKICCHEQGAGFAACGYAAAGGKPGVAFATSGPGATNLITAICHAYFESVPVVFITGQVNTYESRGEFNLRVRQKGFQETDVVQMVSGVTKYAEYVDDVSKLPQCLEKAFQIAVSGRPGAVLLDIPMNVQRSQVEFNIDCDSGVDITSEVEAAKAIADLERELKSAKRAVILAGNGINSVGERDNFKRFAKTHELKIPFVTSMIAVDLFSADFKGCYGFIGAYGSRCANMIVSQCDLLISIGSRMDNRQTGADITKFAPKAKIIRIDTDVEELKYKIKPDEMQINADLRDVMPLLSETEFSPYENDDWESWRLQCDYYREKLNDSGIDDYRVNKLIEDISLLIPDDTFLAADVGQNQVWLAQSFKFKERQRMLFSGGHGAMGFSLPAAIGACYSLPKRNVYSFSGDGGLQMNIQELQFIRSENLPVKIFVLNNSSLGMIRCFQEMYFDSIYSYTVKGGGYTSPDFIEVAKAYGIDAFRIKSAAELEKHKNRLIDNTPVLFDVDIGDRTYVTPKLAYNKPVYDQDPPIERALLEELLKDRKI